MDYQSRLSLLNILGYWREKYPMLLSEKMLMEWFGIQAIGTVVDGLVGHGILEDG